VGNAQDICSSHHSKFLVCRLRLEMLQSQLLRRIRGHGRAFVASHTAIRRLHSGFVTVRQPSSFCGFHRGARANYATDARDSKIPEGSPGESSKPRQRKKDDKWGAEDADKWEKKEGADNVQYTWGSALFTCAVAASVLLYMEYLKRKKEADARAVTTSERIGVPKLGGPFQLTDRKGVVRTDEDYKGQYLLIYFGFTFCPDICPQEMEKQTRVIELLDAEFGPIATPVFISIDPKRDDVEAVDDYCKEFHPRIVGLTGTPEQVKKVSRAYRVYYNEGLRTDDQDYLIDHSIIHYFVGKNGKFIDFFGKNMTAQEMADSMKQVIVTEAEKQRLRKERRGVESVDED